MRIPRILQTALDQFALGLSKLVDRLIPDQPVSVQETRNQTVYREVGREVQLQDDIFQEAWRGHTAMARRFSYEFRREDPRADEKASELRGLVSQSSDPFQRIKALKEYASLNESVKLSSEEQQQMLDLLSGWIVTENSNWNHLFLLEKYVALILYFPQIHSAHRQLMNSIPKWALSNWFRRFPISVSALDLYRTLAYRLAEFFPEEFDDVVISNDGHSYQIDFSHQRFSLEVKPITKTRVARDQVCISTKYTTGEGELLLTFKYEQAWRLGIIDFNGLLQNPNQTIRLRLMPR